MSKFQYSGEMFVFFHSSELKCLTDFSCFDMCEKENCIKSADNDFSDVRIAPKQLRKNCN